MTIKNSQISGMAIENIILHVCTMQFYELNDKGKLKL